jgi:hypothetical protein
VGFGGLVDAVGSMCASIATSGRELQLVRWSCGGPGKEQRSGIGELGVSVARKPVHLTGNCHSSAMWSHSTTVWSSALSATVVMSVRRTSLTVGRCSLRKRSPV